MAIRSSFIRILSRLLGVFLLVLVWFSSSSFLEEDYSLKAYILFSVGILVLCIAMFCFLVFFGVIKEKINKYLLNFLFPVLLPVMFGIIFSREMSEGGPVIKPSLALVSAFLSVSLFGIFTIITKKDVSSEKEKFF